MAYWPYLKWPFLFDSGSEIIQSNFLSVKRNIIVKNANGDQFKNLEFFCITVESVQLAFLAKRFKNNVCLKKWYDELVIITWK